MKAEEGKIKKNKTIINISSGSYEYSFSFSKMIEDMINEGFMIVASAGNNNTDACTEESREIDDYGEINQKHYPSSYNNVISVASINNKEENDIFKSNIISDNKKPLYARATFSNYGKCISIYAPGYVKAAMYDIQDLESNILTLNPRNTYNFLSGTSFSAPIVTGISAIIISENPEIEFNQFILKKKLMEISLNDALEADSENFIDLNNIFINTIQK